MKLGDHICVVPFGGSSRERSKLLEKDATDDFLKRGLPSSEPTTSKSTGKSRLRKSKSQSKDKTGKESDRITFSRLIRILQDAYVTTMKSFASKPAGLGGLVMGGNIDLPDATPSRQFQEPRNFVRSWSKRRPDYISSPAPGFTQSVA